MAKEADKEVKAAQDYIRRLNIVSTKGPQANGPTEFIEERADPQVCYKCCITNHYLCMYILAAFNLIFPDLCLC